MELKIWMFPKMGYLKTFTKEEGSDFSNPPLVLIHVLKTSSHKE
jgi:hypothetical protein